MVENYSAWKALDPQERVRRFYNTSLIPNLSDQVMEAELARRRQDHDTVRTIFNHHIENGKEQIVLRKLERRSHEINLDEERDMIVAGFAGLGRIEHVDANSEYKETSQQTSLRRIARVEELYNYLGVEQLPPFSIHGGSMNWPLEIAQDRANTQVILENSEVARNIINEAIANVRRETDQLKLNVDLKVPEEELKESDYEKYLDRKRYLGNISGLGVHMAKLARMDGSIIGMIEAMRYTNEAYKYEKNKDRLATISKWTLDAARSREYNGNLRERITAFCIGSFSLAKTHSFLSGQK
jgi:hypothetical protein